MQKGENGKKKFFISSLFSKSHMLKLRNVGYFGRKLAKRNPLQHFLINFSIIMRPLC